MSEKRHASKDAKATDTYQRTKRAREEREEQRRLVSAQLTCHATGQSTVTGGGLQQGFVTASDRVGAEAPRCLPVCRCGVLTVCLSVQGSWGPVSA